MNMYNILLIGSGGREHALAWKLTQSEKCEELFVLPGNPGISKIATVMDSSHSDFESIAELIKKHDIKFVIVGPENPLVDGFADFISEYPGLGHVVVIGPKKSGAQLEGSKDFAKKFMEKHGIPTAKYKTFTARDETAAFEFIDQFNGKIVLKADGLAAGKGVIILESKEEAKQSLTEFFNGKFGDAGSKVVIEEFLDGIEFSSFIFTDGKNYILLPSAKDYKQIGVGNTGLNTGGMGAVSPVPFLDEELMAKVEQSIIIPTVNGLQKDGIEYIGFIFFGLINVGGEPFVIEYNCRLGDPETEVIVPRIKNDLVEWFEAVENNTLNTFSLDEDPRYATTIMVVSGGYPGQFKKGEIIDGLEKIEECLAFHAGTSAEKHVLKTNGGRVMSFTSLDLDMKEALNKSNIAAKTIIFNGKYFREDIGFDLIEYL